MIRCEIVTPNGKYKEFDTSILNIVSIDGQMGILPSHMPLVTILEVSKLSSVENGEREEYAIAGGLMYFENDIAKILTDSIESKEEIDEDRAMKARDRALEYLKKKDEHIDLKRAEFALKKAINRLKVKNGRY
ncbi:MAG: ATP synthase F1 subunit epsilon [Erysipelotrichaceae bacterium]|jgi:F-type H+-transporting ATPase subunit epsilon|nr:ATP synthase F1 subunit epsilon [Bacillota bacterium]NLP22381.1 ATP synthase F1 subunit epsilon [Erysipelotrichaceae bacterium]HCY07167.1 ATP synthase F1 subunit epsilon [Erysipelotrichaceae bacterium]